MVLEDAVLGQKDIDSRGREIARLSVTTVFDIAFIWYALERIRW